MKAKMKKWLSLLLALALVVSGITVSEITPVYADEKDSTFTLYYYQKDAENAYLNIWKWSVLTYAKGVSQANHPVFSDVWVGEMQAVEGNEGWFSIDLVLGSSEDHDGITIYDEADKKWECGTWDGGGTNTDEYATLVGGTSKAYAITDDTLYTDLAAAGLNLKSDVFTLYYYTTDTDVEGLYLDIWNHTGLKFADTAKTSNEWEWTYAQGVLEPVSEKAGLYSIDLEIVDATKSEEGFDLYKNSGSTKISTYNYGDDDYSTLVGGTSKVYVIKNGTLYKSLSEAGIDSSDNTKEWTAKDLEVLIGTVPSEEDLTTLNFTDTTELAEKLAAAKTCAGNEEATSGDIKKCYDELKDAISNLTIRDDDIFVDKIATISENDIRGMDVSSYISIMDSFDELNEGKTNEADKLGFRDADGKLLDRQGFFNLLADNGVNYIRLRVWNNPYDAGGNGYGGGNNDLDKAVEMGRYATTAGMKVLIDFHFSDFWADPGKQQAPKAWKDCDVDQKAKWIAEFTGESLNTLIDAGVDVGMVQIGNETNGNFCGVGPIKDDKGEIIGTDWDGMNRLFDAGCDAVHEIAKEHDKKILAVLHFTNPETSGKQAGYADSLADYDGDNDGTKEGVSYDVFATSYYPIWHGTLSNLTSVLSNISKKYDKYVMVAETSWANTLEDADGHENTVRKGNNDTKPDGKADWWTISEQGQVDEFRDVLNAVLSIDKGLGAFWWESAWVPVQNAYNADGSIKDEVVAKNKEMWEKHGSGWASSYAKEYDPKDAGKWCGGSAVDNQGFFDADAKLLPSIKVYNYNYLKYGTTTAVKPVEAETQALTVVVGDKIPELPKTVKVTYNDGTSDNQSVTWNATELADVQKKAESIKNLGTYTVSGETSPSGLKVSCKITIEPKNLLQDPGFESEKPENIWSVIGSGFEAFNTKDSRSGKCLHFWKGEEFTFTASQTISVDQAGVYAADYYAQGGNDDGNPATVKLSVSVNTVSGNETDEMPLQGWMSWVCPKLDKITITEDQMIDGKADVTVTATVVGEAGAWGSLDDFRFYLFSVDDEEEPVEPDPNQPVNPDPDPPKQDPPKQDPPKENPTEEGPKPAAAGTVLDSATGSYKVTASADGAAEVAFTKVKNKKATKVTVPATVKDQNGVTYKVTSIAANTFKNNKKIKTVKLGSNIKSIGKNAFKGCTKLTKVTLDKNLEKIESSAFAGCTKLASITVSAKVKEIGGNAFAGCKKLKKVTIKSTVLKKVGKNALKNIHKKAVIKVPAKKLSAYKKLLKGKGQAKTVKIKK